MSGLSLDNSSLLLLPSSSSGGGGFLGAPYGSAGGAGTTDPLPALRAAEANRTIDIAHTAADPQVARDLAAFSAAVAGAKTPAALLRNPTVLKVLLTANGLGDQTQYPALAQKALLSDPTKSTALVKQLSNTAWKSTAQTYQFATKGLAVIQNAKVLQTLKGAYAEVLWRQSLDAGTPGLSNAIDFRDRASTIRSADDILGDPTFRAVVTTALGIPREIAFQNLGAQEKAITAKVDVASFKSAKFVDRFTQRYLIAEQSNAAASRSSGASLDSLAAQSAGLVV